MQVDNDLNQFVATKGFQAFQDPGCTIFPAKSRIFKSGDNLSPVASLIKYRQSITKRGLSEANRLTLEGVPRSHPAEGLGSA